jgi:hypothetical protein
VIVAMYRRVVDVVVRATAEGESRLGKHSRTIQQSMLADTIATRLET